MRKTKMQLVMAIYLVVGLLAQAQPFTDAELKWLKMVNDDQAFAEFPGFREIKEYQKYFGPMVKEYKLSDEEIDFIGIWDIPTGIYYLKKEKNLETTIDEQKLRQVLNGSYICLLPDRRLLIRYYHYDRNFPLRAIIGLWKIDQDALLAKVERIITVKVPLKSKHGEHLKPEDFIETEFTKEWVVLLDNLCNSWDKKLRYLYRPLNTIITKEDVAGDFIYYDEPIRQSCFSSEKYFYRYPLKSEYIRLQEYLKGKTKVWEYIGTEVNF